MASRRTNQSPDRGQMGQTQQADPSVKLNIKKIEVLQNFVITFICQEQITSASVQMREYKKEIESLRQDIAMMENHLSTLNDENIKVLNPLIGSNFDHLTSQITMQKNENEHMQKQLTELKKDKSLMQQQIMGASQKISSLEESSFMSSASQRQHQSSMISTGSDPAKINQLFEKIEKSNNIEIEERSIKNILQKLNHKLIDPSYLAQNHQKEVGTLLAWINKRSGQFSIQGLQSCVHILKHLSAKQEGKQLLRQYGVLEFFNDFINAVENVDIKKDIEDVMRNIVQDQEIQEKVGTFALQTNIFANSSQQQQQQQVLSPMRESSMHNDSMAMSAQNLDRLDDSFAADEAFKRTPIQGIQSERREQTTFNKKEFKMTSVSQRSQLQSQMIQNQNISSDVSHMELMHKQQTLKEQCELPFVMLSEEDEKQIFDLSVQLKFGDFKTVLNAAQYLQNLALFDYPIEVFLQRTDILKALLDLLEGSQGISFTNIAQQSLLIFVQRLRTVYEFLCHNTNKPSHMLVNDKGESGNQQESYIQHCYPQNNIGRWSSEEQQQDIKKYGISGSLSKSSSLSAATSSGSLSAKSAIGLILTKSIYLLKDTEKLGLYIQLINETFETLLTIYKVERNTEFCELIHLCLFAFDSVCDYYKEQIFEEVLIQPVLPLVIKFISLLDTIPSNNNKYKAPFTETLYNNTQNLQRTLRRALFKNYFKNSESSEIRTLLQFFERLQSELQNVNLLQVNVAQSYEKALKCYERFMNVQNFKLNSQLLYEKDDQQGITFIENLNQFFLAINLLEELSYCVEMKMDFPFEQLLIDCMVYSILVEESKLESKIDQVEKLFISYVSIHIPEVRERILRKTFQRLRIAHALQLNNKKEINNNMLLSKFIYRKHILNQLVTGILINPEISNEESKLQMSIGQLTIKILIIAYNEGGFVAQKTNLNQHILIFHSLLPKYPDLIGLIDLIEENSSRNCRFQRLLRDLFSQDSAKREFATSVLRNNLSKDNQDQYVKDLLKETFDLKQPSQEVHQELDLVNQNYDYSTFNVENIWNILQSQSSDMSIKKSCLEQLTLLLFDQTNKKGKLLFKNTMGIKDVFTFVVEEIARAYNTCQNYLRQQVSLLEDSNHILFLNECLRFLFLSYLFYSDEEVVKSFFNKLRSLNQQKEQDQKNEAFENYLNSILFFQGSNTLRKNAMKLLYVTVFHPLFLCSKTTKYQAPNGSYKKALTLLVPDFCLDSFIFIVPFTPQSIRQPQRQELILSDEQKMYIDSKFNETEEIQNEHAVLKQVATQFVNAVENKANDYNSVMRCLETLQNYVLSIQAMSDHLINVEVMRSLVELLKTLPTRDFEFNFLADILMLVNQILASYKRFDKLRNLEFFVSRIVDALKFHQLPFLIETGISNFENDQGQFPSKSHFINRTFECLLLLTQVDMYLKQALRTPSALQDKIFTNEFINYLFETYSNLKDNFICKKKILSLLYLIITQFDTRQLIIDHLPALLVNQVASHRLSLLFSNTSLILISLRTLIFLHQRRLFSSKQMENNETELSVNVSSTTMQHLQKYKSFGWLVRFTESRDSRIRCLSWDLITEVFDYEFLKQHPSIVQTAVNSYLKHKELFSVKISVLKFLNKLCDAVIFNCEMSRDENNENVNEENFIGSRQESFSIKTLLQTIHKQGLISQIYAMLGNKDFPLLFGTLTFKLVHKLVQMDSKKALPVLTQLDYWTFLVEMIDINFLKSHELSESRTILTQMKQSILKIADPTAFNDTLYLALNSILELTFEAFKKDSQLANLLVKTTKLMPNLFMLLQVSIDKYNRKELPLRNKSLMIVFIDRITKLLHISLFHPQDYSVDVLKKFLFEKPFTTQMQEQPRNWIYICDMFKIINENSSSNFHYGQVDVKLALCRFISEFLLRLPRNNNSTHHLDELIRPYHSEFSNEDHEEVDMETYGGAILIEYGSVFKALYVDKQESQGINRGSEDMKDEQENAKIDICMCLSVLLASSQSAKTAAIDHNLLKKVTEICAENIQALQLGELNKFTTGGGKSLPNVTAQKSVMKQSIMGQSSLSQKMFESQFQHRFKYASCTDQDQCQRETIRMLEIIRHTFYCSGLLLVPQICSKDKSMVQSKIQSGKSILKKKEEGGLGSILTSLMATILEEFSNNQQYESIVHECLMTCITYASQNISFKNTFITGNATQSLKKTSLIKVVTEKILLESPQSNSKKMKLLFTLLRSLSVSSEIAKELMKLKTIEEMIGKLQPMCKNEKDIKLMKHYLSQFSAFLSAYAYSEDGQKAILKLKPVFDFIIFVMDTTSPSSSQGLDQATLSNIIVHSLLFIRNTSFTRSNKLHFLSNNDFLPCLLAFMTSPDQSPKVKAYTAGCLWVLLYNHQGVKAILNRDQVTTELINLKQDYQRQCDIGNYQHFVHPKQETNTKMLSEVQTKENDAISNKRMNDFTLLALNGILSFLQQQ